METRRDAKSGRRTLPTGLLGMLALVVGVEAFVTRHEIDAVSPEEWQYLLARRQTASRARGYDLLIFGDSQAKFGLLPKVLAGRSGLRAYNLAIWGAQPAATYDLLRRAVEGGARPRAVVVDFHPLLMVMPPMARWGQLPFLLDYGATLRIGRETNSPAFLLHLLSRRVLPSLRCRTALQSWARAAFEGRSSRNRSLTPDLLRHCAENDGAVIVPAMPGRPLDVAAHQRLAYGRNWTPDRTNADYLRRFLELAEARGATVYWLIPPIQPALLAATEAAGFDARYDAFVKKQLARFPNLVILDGRHAGYDPAVFLDLDHLGREGAFALSEDLGAMLRRLDGSPRPAGDRWLSLPIYRPRSTDPAIVATKVDALLPEPAAVRR